MAKKTTDLSNPFTRTEPAPQPERGRRRDPSDPIRSKGVGLRTSEWERLQALADGLGVELHPLCVWLLRHGLAELEAGRLTPTTETKTVLK